MESKLVGVIGGLGPKATTYFMNMVIDYTYTECDQDNVDMIVCQTSSTPDRTAYILENSNDNPLKKMKDNALLLQNIGCDFLVMPCNTSCYFYDEMEKGLDIKLYNIVFETLKECQRLGAKKIGLMATTGTIQSKVYEKYLDYDAQIFIPSSDIQEEVMKVIYDGVKKNLPVDKKKFIEIINYFKDNGCDRVVMGCTELSVALKDLEIQDDAVTDSLTVLALKTIKESGKKLK